MNSPYRIPANIEKPIIKKCYEPCVGGIVSFTRHINPNEACHYVMSCVCGNKYKVYDEVKPVEKIRTRTIYPFYAYDIPNPLLIVLPIIIYIIFKMFIP